MRIDHLAGDAGDLPVPQPPRRPGIGLDRVPKFHCDARGRDPADHGGGVQMLAPQRGVGGLPSALFVAHLDHVGHQHMVMWQGSPPRDVACRVWA
jgi:hypothetical protein